MAKTHFFDVALAQKYGPIESILLSNLCYWIEKNIHNQKNFHKGRYWVYNSTSAFEKLFPYLTGDQIRGKLNKLQEKGVLFTDNFNKIGYDRTLWYSVSDEVMRLYTAGKSSNLPFHAKVREKTCPNGQMHDSDSPNAFAQTGSTAQMGNWGENGENSPVLGEFGPS